MKSLRLNKNVKYNGDHLMIDMKQSVITSSCFFRLSLLGYGVNPLFRIGRDGMYFIKYKKPFTNIDCKLNGVDDI